ncbi:HNH endonuclease signature motif containing protein [Nocardia sp. NPDC002869]|uniref:HNH endonuclease signature motif containing protein n=1 Tax=Nocardia sp. NPDC002869 TaxID=3161032 RepID=UPI00398D26AC
MATYNRYRRRSATGRGLDDRTYRKATKQLRARSQTCWICGGRIDVSLPYTDPESWTADHVVPRSKGGHLLGEMRAAHRRCNSKRGNKEIAPSAQLPTSRQWLPTAVPSGRS